MSSVARLRSVIAGGPRVSTTPSPTVFVIGDARNRETSGLIEGVNTSYHLYAGAAVATPAPTHNNPRQRYNSIIWRNAARGSTISHWAYIRIDEGYPEGDYYVTCTGSSSFTNYPIIPRTRVNGVAESSTSAGYLWFNLSAVTNESEVRKLLANFSFSGQIYQSRPGDRISYTLERHSISGR